MPRLSKKARIEWSLFIGDNGRRQYNSLCRKCRRMCKQSFRVIVCYCPKYESKRRGGNSNNGKGEYK